MRQGVAPKGGRGRVEGRVLWGGGGVLGDCGRIVEDCGVTLRVAEHCRGEVKAERCVIAGH